MTTYYTCEITFHRAEHVPIGDLNNFSCDPYIHASLQLPTEHHTPLVYRTHTVRRTLNPTYDARWVVTGIPAAGFMLTLRLRDEDPGNHDDRLGKVDVRFPRAPGEHLAEGWASGETECKVEKRRGSLRAHAATYLVSMVTRGAVSHRARIWISARVVAQSSGDRIGTLGPPRYTQHFSPLIGRLVRGGTAAKTSLSTSTFVASRLQLGGPPPPSLRHRYVGYAPFIKSMFKKSGIRGKILNRGLHQQYYTVYSYDKHTVYGIAGEGQYDTDGTTRHAKEKEKEKAPAQNGDAQPPHDALAREFLRMTSCGAAGRLFTYVITLDSEWRFTETGAEFGVDLLSKHSMHANVAHEIAFSGEFFVRRVKGAHEDGVRKDGDGGAGTDDGDGAAALKDVAPADGDDSTGAHKDGVRADKDDGPGADNDKGADPEGDPDPASYELVIDNDSGTYRPLKERLPTLQAWLARAENLGALARVTAMDGFDETLKQWKAERQEEKRRAKSGEAGPMAMAPRRGSSVSSISSGVLGRTSVSSSDVAGALAEDAKRARENDEPPGSLREEG